MVPRVLKFCFCIDWLLFVLFPKIVVKGIVKCRSWPEPDDFMSFSAMDGI